jgi:hypothetical protein
MSIIFGSFEKRKAISVLKITRVEVQIRVAVIDIITEAFA